MLSGRDGYKVWISRLAGLVGDGALAGVGVDGFLDERGHRRAVDGFLIGWLLGERVVGGVGEGLDVLLWGVLAGGGEVERSSFVGGGPLQEIGLVRSGAVSVEVWTERELSAIQALWTLGVSRREAGLRLRAEEAARWCVEELQPDNATGHPWGVNAFVGLSFRGDVEAELYAQTLVHNCCVSRGVPDRFSSLVLLASARSLEMV